MRHTFIPNAEQAHINREYRARVTAALCIALATAVLVGAIALFPAFLRVSLAERSALQTIAANDTATSSDAQAIQTELSADGALVVLLAADHGAPRLSDAIRQISSVRSHIALTSLSVSRNSGGSITAVLQGVAPTRDDLLTFKGRLEDLAPGASVDLPIDELAKTADIEFSMQLVAKLP